MSDMDTTVRKGTSRIVQLASKDGAAAGKAFVEKYGLGTNPYIDEMVLEGLETNVSLIIQRLPWASVVPQTAIESTLAKLNIPISEVVDDLIWTYMATYDLASRKVIRDAIRNRKG